MSQSVGVLFENRQPEKDIDVSIIIPVYGRFDLLQNLLNSWLQYYSKNISQEIIIIDDGSLDNISPVLAKYAQQIYGVVFKNQENEGFAIACNIGLNEAQGQYVVFVNTDIVFTQEWLPQLIQSIEQNAQAGAVTPVLVAPDGTIQHAGAMLTEDDFDSPSFDHKHYYKTYPKDISYIKANYTESFSAACFLSRNSFLKELGGFDPVFSKGYGFDDADLALKMAAKDKYNLVCPEVQMIHSESGTYGKEIHNSKEKDNNRVIFYQKWRETKPDSSHQAINKLNKKAKQSILVISHGLPPKSIAGVEVYTYNLIKELSNYDIDTNCLYADLCTGSNYQSGQILFERYIGKANIFRAINSDPNYDFLLNSTNNLRDPLKPNFVRLLRELNPNVVHFQHTNFMSIEMVSWTRNHSDAKIVYTLNEYIPICGNQGQLVDTSFNLCDGPESNKCARCLGHPESSKIITRSDRYKNNLNKTDLLIAPSNFLKDQFLEWGVPANKLIVSDYGVAQFIKKNPQQYLDKPVLIFGFLGALTPFKGLTVLLKAFQEPIHGAKLEIHGVCNIDSIKNGIDQACNEWITYHGPYHPDSIQSILDRIDVLIVPSIWWENSPIVIHEARAAGIPVIASDIGGMKELVLRLGGLMFERKNSKDLRKKIIHCCENRSVLSELSKTSPYIKTIQENAVELMNLYKNL